MKGGFVFVYTTDYEKHMAMSDVGAETGTMLYSIVLRLLGPTFLSLRVSKTSSNNYP